MDTTQSTDAKSPAHIHEAHTIEGKHYMHMIKATHGVINVQSDPIFRIDILRLHTYVFSALSSCCACHELVWRMLFVFTNEYSYCRAMCSEGTEMMCVS